MKARWTALLVVLAVGAGGWALVNWIADGLLPKSLGEIAVSYSDVALDYLHQPAGMPAADDDMRLSCAPLEFAEFKTTPAGVPICLGPLVDKPEPCRPVVLTGNIPEPLTQSHDEIQVRLAVTVADVAPVASAIMNVGKNDVERIRPHDGGRFIVGKKAVKWTNCQGYGLISITQNYFDH